MSGLLLVEQGELSLVSVVDSLSSNRESLYGVSKDHVVSYSLGGDISLFHIRLLPRCPPLKGDVGLVIYSTFASYNLLSFIDYRCLNYGKNGMVFFLFVPLLSLYNYGKNGMIFFLFVPLLPL